MKHFVKLLALVPLALLAGAALAQTDPTAPPPFIQIINPAPATNPYDTAPLVRLSCADQDRFTRPMIVYGANACAFIVYTPPGVSDAVRTDTTVTLTYYWPVGTILSPRWELRSREIIGTLPVQYGTSSSFFEAYYYYPTAAGQLSQTLQNIFTSPDRRKSMVTAAISAVGGATINPLAALGELEAVGGFLYELTQKKAILSRVDMSVRVCNYSVCTPDKTFSIPIEQFN